MKRFIRLRRGPAGSAAMVLFIASAVAGQSRQELTSESIRRVSEAERSGAVSDLAEASRLIVKQTNAVRAEQELPPLVENDSLRKAAEYFADFMADTDKYGHTADDKQPRDRAKEHGYEPCKVAENIARQ